MLALQIRKLCSSISFFLCLRLLLYIYRERETDIEVPRSLSFLVVAEELLFFFDGSDDNVAIKRNKIGRVEKWKKKAFERSVRRFIRRAFAHLAAPFFSESLVLCSFLVFGRVFFSIYIYTTHERRSMPAKLQRAQIRGKLVV